MITLSAGEARRWLLHAVALDRPFPPGVAGARELLDTLGCIQLDPIDRVGTNAELVAFARVPGLVRGELHGALTNASFEHFAKERCLVHPRYLAAYRSQAVQTRWWRNDERMERLDSKLIEDVYAEVRERGPVTSQQLADRGKTAPMDWSGWKGTSSLSSLALEVLWVRCDVVVPGRDARGRRLYDVPERALPEWIDHPVPSDVLPSLVVDRVRTAGLLSTSQSPMWSTLGAARTDGTVDHLVEDGRLLLVQVEGQAKPYLAVPELARWRDPGSAQRQMTVLGPLDPLLWDRGLVRLVFGFDYVWEIYKPAAVRRWGYYVVPLLHGDALVGRLEAHREGNILLVDRTWTEQEPLDTMALGACLDRLATQNRCDGWAAPCTTFHIP